MASSTPTPGPPEGFESMMSGLGISDPRATTSITSTTQATAGADPTQEADGNAQDATTEPASAVTLDPLGSSSAGTALTGATLAPDAEDNSSGQDAGQESSGMSEGTKIGIGVGVGVGVAILIALVALFFVMRKRRRNKYTSANTAETMRGQPAMTSTEPALAGIAALGRSSSYRSNARSSYHSLAHTSPPPVPDTALDPMPEATKGTIPAQPTIIPPSQQSLPREQPEADTPRGRRSLEAELVTSPGAQSLPTPAPPYDDAPSPVDGPPSRPISPVSPVSSMGSRPPSLRGSFESDRGRL